MPVKANVTPCRARSSFAFSASTRARAWPTLPNPSESSLRCIGDLPPRPPPQRRARERYLEWAQSLPWPRRLAIRRTRSERNEKGAGSQRGVDARRLRNAVEKGGHSHPCANAGAKEDGGSRDQDQSAHDEVPPSHGVAPSRLAVAVTTPRRDP